MIESETRAIQRADNAASDMWLLDQFCREHKLALTRKGDWRVCKPKTGEINGLSNSRGTIRITNGIDCYIVREDNTLFHGHIASFIADKEEKDDSLVASRPRKSRSLVLDELYAGLTI